MKIAVIDLKIIILLAILSNCLAKSAIQKDKLFWYEENYDELKKRLSLVNLRPENVGKVKNVVLFVGDGMGLSTITASRVLKGQRTGKFNEKLIFDEFPASALVKTDTLNSQISESAAAATALFCGVKTNFESLGVDVTAANDSCSNVRSHTNSLMAWAQDKNMKTGFVTTSRVTHATPAGLYAHTLNRYWEDDSKTTDLRCKDIAKQLVENEPGKSFNVILGGGLRSFRSRFETNCRRKDGRNLTAEWVFGHRNAEFVSNRDGLMNLKDETEHLMGLFSSSHMSFDIDRNVEQEPSLTEMTLKAIKVLSRKNRHGFLLVVEAGKIDIAHHHNNAFRALDDTLALERAVEAVVRNCSLINLSETLVIVTADHSSAMSYSGYATPKNYSVLGLDKHISNIDKKHYQLLTYASGIGHGAFNLTAAMKDYHNAYHKAAIPSSWGNHAGEDVPLYAIGVLSNFLFSGTIDQTFIPHAISFALCLSQYHSRCEKQSANYEDNLDQVNARRPNDKMTQLRQRIYSQKMKALLTESKTEKIVPEQAKEEEDVDVSYEEMDLYSMMNLTGNLTSSNLTTVNIANEKNFNFCIHLISFIFLIKLT